MPPSPLTSIEVTIKPSSRVLLAVLALNRCAAHPDFGASKNKIQGALHNLPSSPSAISIPKDRRNLVALLIKDNEVLYNQLLHNKFCQAMSKASTGDKTVTDGFKRYMIQDFLFCQKIMVSDIERASKAPDVATYERLVQTIKDHGDYSVSLLRKCTEPTKLGIPVHVVIGARLENATAKYIEFSLNTAEHSNWIVSLVAMIPCVQSYYQIAKLLEHSSCHKDTLWYKFWVEENLKLEYDTRTQVAFFITNFEAWGSVPYERLCQIFREACHHEINLWAVGENTGDMY